MAIIQFLAKIQHLIINYLRPNKSNVDQRPIVFAFPKVFNSKYDVDRLLNDTVNSIGEVFPIVIGKYKFCDTIDIGVENADTSLLKDYFFEDFSRFTIIDSLDVNGFEVLTDYTSTIYFQNKDVSDLLFTKYYPVYLINSTSSNKLFLAKDNYAYGIQEAKFIEKKGSYNFWYAIESLGSDWCGNGSWGVIVHPQEFILILMRKYNGNYETSLRVRIRNGETTYVSKGFKGVINEKQFNIPENVFANEDREYRYRFASDFIFFGAIPKWPKKN